MKAFLILAASAAALALAFALALGPRAPSTPAASAARAVQQAHLPIEAAPPLVIDLAPTIIVARTPLRARRAPVQPPPREPQPVATMHCSGWRPLEMGAGSVQLCSSAAAADDSRFRRSPF